MTQLGAKPGRNQSYSIDGRQTQLGALPVGIETSVYARVARAAVRSPLSRSRRQPGGQRLILGVDRIDYSKGIIHQLNAFDRFLELNPGWRSRVTFLQIAPKSRSEIKEYADIESDLTTVIGKINGRYGEATWTPVRYVNRSYPRTVLAGVYRAAAVALVTPLRDGMNLVAKEYVAAQDADDPGVLILSQFAGAAPELGGALIVNPHETESVAAAIVQALEMPLAQRRERHGPMLAHLLERNVDQWAESFLATLGETRQRPRLIEGLRWIFGVSSP